MQLRFTKREALGKLGASDRLPSFLPFHFRSLKDEVQRLQHVFETVPRPLRPKNSQPGRSRRRQWFRDTTWLASSWLSESDVP